VVSRTLVSLFEQLVKQSRKLPPEVLATLSGIDDPSRLADSIAAHLTCACRTSRKCSKHPTSVSVSNC
jgi:ATP-dependent Lon protease